MYTVSLILFCHAVWEIESLTHLLNFDFDFKNELKTMKLLHPDLPFLIKLNY